MRELDHLQIPLAGRHLIEASAGTGKTFAIALLYLRLLIEKALLPEQILAVTYTEAATKELKGRIRGRIVEALRLYAGEESNDELLKAVCFSGKKELPPQKEIKRHLEHSLSSFDLASIHTIHSFSLRTLAEFAFECSYPFDTELVTDQGSLYQEIVDDFWRKELFGRSEEEFVKFMLDAKIAVSELKNFAQRIMKFPKAEILPHISDKTKLVHKTALSKFHAEVKKTWCAKRSELIDILENHKGLSRGPYKKDAVALYAAAMDDYCAGEVTLSFSADARKFCKSSLEKGTTGKGSPPSHPFFDLCQQLVAQIDITITIFKAELIRYCRSELTKRKKNNSISFYDDLLQYLDSALSGPDGTELADRLRSKYPAALIDEFQDTDPVQYSIFRQIYRDDSSTLFLIGDPKQAIYRFRGGDIFSYLAAAADISDANRHTLTRNFRSSPNLLEAFNTIFDTKYPQFLVENIEYHPVTSGKELSSADEEEKPFKLWLMRENAKGDPPAPTEASDMTAEGVASEAVKLLNSGEFRPSDLAVIVRNKWQGGLVQQALGRKGVPSVMRNEETIFESAEAAEMLTLMEAAASPTDAVRIKSFLASSLVGWSVEDIAALAVDEDRWQALLLQFSGYRHVWEEHGFMLMVSRLLADYSSRGRLLVSSGGERMLTNLLHCCEIIHDAEHRQHFGIQRLIAWFREKIIRKEGAEEYQIRLETDDMAVKILTVHISKGLEFPVVFAPFLWTGILGAEDVATFYERDSGSVIHDIGSSVFFTNCSLTDGESLAEALRLFYVAVTRAEKRCYLVAGQFKKGSGKSNPHTSPVAYLFHAPEDISADADPAGHLAERVEALSKQEILDEIAARVSPSPHIETVSLPEPDDDIYRNKSADDQIKLTCRNFKRHIDKSWRIGSFSMLSRQERGEHDFAERYGMEDENRQTPALQPAQQHDIFSLPKGAATGVMLHELLEKSDLSSLSCEKSQIALSKTMAKYRINEKFAPALSAMLQNVASAELRTPSDEIFTLAAVSQEKIIAEMEFFMPLGKITPGSLAAAMSVENKDDAAVWDALSFSPMHGALKGFIDMVFEHEGRFYIIDWKSNHLGYSASDYSAESLRSSIADHLYSLQYMIYTVALDRYLAQRLPGYSYEENFGGVYYLYLRGIENGSRNGIYYDLPSETRVAALRNLLHQGEYA